LTGYTAVQISRIRRRFAEEGVAGLTERPRSGRPPRLTEAKGARIVALILKAPPPGLTQRSTRELAERVGVSYATGASDLAPADQCGGIEPGREQIQALERTQPLLPLRPNLPARQTHDYERHGLTSLYAALEAAPGKVLGAVL